MSAQFFFRICVKFNFWMLDLQNSPFFIFVVTIWQRLFKSYRFLSNNYCAELCPNFLKIYLDRAKKMITFRLSVTAYLAIHTTQIYNKISIHAVNFKILYTLQNKPYSVQCVPYEEIPVIKILSCTKDRSAVSFRGEVDYLATSKLSR